jgi:hypothetical protein
MQIQHWLSKLPGHVREWLGEPEHRVSTGPNADKPDYAFPKIGVEAEYKWRGGDRPVNKQQVTRSSSGMIEKDWTTNDRSVILDGPNRRMTNHAYLSLSQASIAPRRGTRGWTRHLETLISTQFPGWTYLKTWMDRHLVVLDSVYFDLFSRIPYVVHHKVEDDKIRIGKTGSTHEGYCNTGIGYAMDIRSSSPIKHTRAWYAARHPAKIDWRARIERNRMIG